MKTNKQVQKIIKDLESHIQNTYCYPSTKEALQYRISGYKSAFLTKGCQNLKPKKLIENMFINLIEKNKENRSEENCQHICAIADVLNLTWDNKNLVWYNDSNIKVKKYSEV